MRKTMIETDSPETAHEMAPWACGIYRCEGGFWAFEDARDCSAWEGELTDDDDRTNYAKANKAARKTVYRADCDQFENHSTGYHATPEAAEAAFWAENTFSAAERARVVVYTLAEDAGAKETIELAEILADMGSPSPALGIEAR